MGSRGGLGVVLHREGRDIDTLQAFDHIVVQVDVRDEHTTVFAVFIRRFNDLADRRVDRETVVVGGDLDLAGGHVTHRLVDAVMTELELVGLKTERTAKELIAEADAEEGIAGVEHLAQQIDFGRGLLRVARAVGEEDAIRIQCLDIVQGDG